MLIARLLERDREMQTQRAESRGKRDASCGTAEALLASFLTVQRAGLYIMAGSYLQTRLLVHDYEEMVKQKEKE